MQVESKIIQQNLVNVRRRLLPLLFWSYFFPFFCTSVSLPSVLLCTRAFANTSYGWVGAQVKSCPCFSHTSATVLSRAGTLVQRPRAKLGTWLQHSGETIRNDKPVALMVRLERHEQDQYNKTVSFLDTGTMPSLVCGDRAHTRGVNPAILYMLHASGHHLLCNNTSQPASPRSSTRRSELQDTVTPMQRRPAAQGYKAAVREVWWLFDSGTPYLAEVFKSGAVPEDRLPHVDKSRIQGRTVARVLGRGSHFIQMMPPNARTYMFSTWYDVCFVTGGVRRCFTNRHVACNLSTSCLTCRTSCAEAEVMQPASRSALVALLVLPR
jgi:hypothetical protein